MRRHGWQRPLHPLQIVGMSIYSFLVVAFYCFLGLFLGNRIAEITVTAIFSAVALSVIFVFVRCTAINPTDRTSIKKKRKPKSKSSGFSKLNYGCIMRQIIVRFFKRLERKILRSCIRRKYLLDPWKTSAQIEPLLPFHLLVKDDSISPHPKEDEDDFSFCTLCNLQVRKHSKHCRTCNRCVEGFDHHCRWLNNCIGKKNYTSFILLMVFVLLMLMIEGGTAIAIFIRCFVDKKGIEVELEEKLYVKFPRGVLAAISVLLVLMTAYGSAALGQLFFFHVVLIRKGMRTYDYIMAAKEENKAMMDLEEEEAFVDEDSEFDFSSDESDDDDDDDDTDSPEKPTFVSRFKCTATGCSSSDHKTSSQQASNLSIKIDGEAPKPFTLTKKGGFHAGIDPWKLINMSKEKAVLAAEKARERTQKQNMIPPPRAGEDGGSLKPLPLPLETKRGPLMNLDKNVVTSTGTGTRRSSTAGGGDGLTPLILKGAQISSSPSPRRRFSSSPTTLLSVANTATPKHKYRTNFDLKLTQVSRELETYISRQVLTSIFKKQHHHATEEEPSSSSYST